MISESTGPANPPGIASAVALAWVRIYTLGLPDAVRSRRIEEIHSDTWEQWSDQRSANLSAAAIGAQTLSRLIRGAPADLLWRTHLGGLHVNIHVPIDRLAGLFLLLLIAASTLSFSASGYDTSAGAGFTGELERLASVSGWQAEGYVMLQVASGFAMIVAGAVFYLQLREKAPGMSLIAALALITAGIVGLISASLYGAAANLADEWRAASPENEQSVRVVARGFLLALSYASPIGQLALALGVHGLAYVTSKFGFVPAKLNLVCLASVVCMAAGVIALPGNWDLPWIFFAGAVVLLLTWLLIAGAWLLLGGGENAKSSTLQPGLPAQPGGA